jgi:hypothetical protein
VDCFHALSQPDHPHITAIGGCSHAALCKQQNPCGPCLPSLSQDRAMHKPACRCLASCTAEYITWVPSARAVPTVERFARPCFITSPRLRHVYVTPRPPSWRHATVFISAKFHLDSFSHIISRTRTETLRYGYQIQSIGIC